MSETRTVDPGRAKRKDEGFYASVQDALKECMPGDTVLINKGTHGGFIVDKNVTIRCEEKGLATIRVKDDNCIIVKSECKLENMKIAQDGPDGANFNCIRVQQGKCTITDCDITGKGAKALVVVINGSSDVKMSGCCVHDSLDAGVMVDKGAKAVITDCEITRNAKAGISMGADCTGCDVKNCKFEGGKDAAVLYHSKASGKIADNTFTKNRGAGQICLMNGANPEVVDNTITDGRTGIWIASADGTFRDNTIEGNEFCGMQVKGGANPTVQSCYFYNNMQCGIAVHDEGKGKYSTCEFKAYGGKEQKVAIEISSRATPEFKNNDIFDGMNGIVCTSEGKGMCTKNKIYDMSGNGIDISKGADPQMVENQVWNCKLGCYAYDKGLGWFSGNKIFNCTTSGIETKEGGNPTFEMNKIYGCKTGVHCQNGGRGIFKENTIYDHTLAGVEVKTEAWPLFKENEIKDNNIGIYCYQEGLGKFRRNKISNSVFANVELSTEGDGHFLRNEIFNSQRFGVYCRQESKGYLRRNLIYGNMGANVETRKADDQGEGANPTFDSNKIYSGNQEGVKCWDGGKGVFKNNMIFDNAMPNVSCLSGADPTFEGNRIFSGNAGGIQVAEGGMGMFKKNSTYDNAEFGMKITQTLQEGGDDYSGVKMDQNLVMDLMISSGAPAVVSAMTEKFDANLEKKAGFKGRVEKYEESSPATSFYMTEEDKANDSDENSAPAEKLVKAKSGLNMTKAEMEALIYAQQAQLTAALSENMEGEQNGISGKWEAQLDGTAKFVSIPED